MSSVKYEKIDTFPFEEVWHRVTQATDIKSQEDLARVVGVSQGAISGWKKKNVWPEEWACRIARKYGFLTEWILSGEGPKTLNDLTKKNEFDFPILNDLNAWLEELVVGEPYRKEWFRAAIEDSFPMFREWKKRKEKEEGRSDIDPQSNVA